MKECCVSLGEVEIHGICNISKHKVELTLAKSEAANSTEERFDASPMSYTALTTSSLISDTTEFDNLSPCPKLKIVPSVINNNTLYLVYST